MNKLWLMAALGAFLPLGLALVAPGCSKPCNDLSVVCGRCSDQTYAQDCRDIVNEANDDVCNDAVATFEQFCVDDSGAGGGFSGTTCANGGVVCNGVCVDLDASPDACGNCLNQCSGNAPLCAAGECVATCPAAQPTECNGGCVDVDADPNNCGGCGTVCGQGEVCNGGTCSADGCDAGDANCDGACVDLAKNPLHCGGCGQSCQGGLCNAGTCSGTCDNGLVECEGTCVDPTTDPDHCGGCGNPPCAAPSDKCQTGTCVDACTNGFVDCGGSCVDTNTDGAHCGACGNICPSGSPCVSGSCSGGGCPAGLTDCSGSCSDVASDPNNCGACGEVCDTAGGEVCSLGVCTTACAMGFTNCSGACVDTTTDPSNCGGCDVVCGTGQVCDGTCTTACGSGKSNCNGACVDLMGNVKHCGQCGTSCADANICTVDSCSMGSCNNLSGAVNCDDGNPCTDESCDPKLGCGIPPAPISADDIVALCVQTQNLDPNAGCIFCDPLGAQCNQTTVGSVCNWDIDDGAQPTCLLCGSQGGNLRCLQQDVVCGNMMTCNADPGAPVLTGTPVGCQ